MTVKLQIPMDKSTKDGLEKRAAELGFDSAQAYIRFWAKAEVDGRKVDFGEDDWGQPSPEATKRINRWAEEAIKDSRAGKLKSFDSAEEMMKHLRNL